jgi:hypothetical protein
MLLIDDLRFASESTLATGSCDVNQIFGSSGRRRRSPRAICSARSLSSAWVAMPTLIFLAMILLLEDALGPIEDNPCLETLTTSQPDVKNVMSREQNQAILA